MRNVLRITTSVFEENSISSQLTDELLVGLRAQGEEFDVKERDFHQDPVPHLDAAWLQALMTPEADRSDEQQGKVDYSDSLIAEIMAADTIVIALPMYNFTVPSMLKAWIDHIARAGEHSNIPKPVPWDCCKTRRFIWSLPWVVYTSRVQLTFSGRI